MSELERVFVEIQHDFTKSELAKMGIDLAERRIEIDDVKEGHKEIRSEQNAVVKDMENDSKELSNKIVNGYEMNNTDCRLRLNYDTDTREYLAIKSDKILHTEPFHEEDFQTDIKDAS